MCGIAGVVDLGGKRPVPAGMLQAMAGAIRHRGPDEDGFLDRPGIGLASRRLSIVGLADGRQPIRNENSTVFVVFNGEIFDYPQFKSRLEGRGHRFITHCDTEVIAHLWEDHHEDMVERLRGQFALALWDGELNQVILARDRFGICPLYWTRQTSSAGDWLLFASEIKALLASGMVEARPDVRGINHIFTFFALPGPITCFEGIQLLPPGHYLSIKPGNDRQPAQVAERAFWHIDFPDAGAEDPRPDRKKLVDDFQDVMLRAVERRLRADVPVVSYLSGGVDSSLVVALANHIRREPIPTFTIQIKDPHLDESREASLVAKHVKAEPVIVGCGHPEVLNVYPRLIWAAEGPVIDTACCALLMLAEEVHAHGYKVAITGEGSDEWLAGYPWFKVHRLLRMLDRVPGLPLGQLARRAYLRLTGAPAFPWGVVKETQDLAGGSSAWLDIYGIMSLNKLRFFNSGMIERLKDNSPYADIGPNPERIRRWHPLNRSLYLGGRVMLPGLLLNAKGDRVAMHSSVETRYPFLDEEVFDFLAGINPRWKFHGMTDKYLVRLLAERWLPKKIAWRRKAMFRAPFDSFHMDPAPAFVEQLLSPESLRETGFFDAQAVAHWRRHFREMWPRSPHRATLEMGLVGVIGTQLWYHTFIDGRLADLPSAANGTMAPDGRAQPAPAPAVAASR
jgi:asparagine synthase (glutamine-hydrolysing)